MSDLADRLRRRFALDAAVEASAIYNEELFDDITHLTDAAVLVPIIDAPDPRVLLTLRDAGLRAHAGQVAFPGGRLDPEDEDAVAGALREAWEEIGLPGDRVDVVGTGGRYATGTGYLITPVIGVIPPDLVLRPHQAEVAALFEVPLDHLLAEVNHLRRSVEYQGRDRQYYEIDWPDYRIWGATAGMIVNLAPLLREAIG